MAYSRIREWFLNKLNITRQPCIKVYRSYGDEDAIVVFGHVLKQSPLPKKKYTSNFLRNTLSLVRLFLVHPVKYEKVQMEWEGQIIITNTNQDGFFRFEWKSPPKPVAGYHKVQVELITGKYAGIRGEGTVMVPHDTEYVYVSDIDDTFLISHSSNLRKRLYVLLTKNARTRKPFEGVARHYRMLSEGIKGDNLDHPFFFVSSSEWNLYDYIREFSSQHKLPDGVYLLNRLKRWTDLHKTGQNNHSTKYVRIARLLEEYPRKKFVLLGDDTQEDPNIYNRLVKDFNGRITCVYMRQVRKSPKEHVLSIAEQIKQTGTEFCYFEHSTEAIEHSAKIGLIKQAHAIEARATNERSHSLRH